MKHFITFEGGEGSGKSSQSKLLSKSLSEVNEKNLLTREPGGTVFSEKIRKLLVGKNEFDISSDTELLLIYAARYEHLKKKVIPSLKTKTVICDRFIHSTYSYQINSSDFDKKINFFHKNFGFNIFPDLTFLLDIPVEVGIKRSLKIKKSETRFEKRTKEFHQRVRKNFLRLSEKDNKVLKINALLSKKEIHHKIINHINSKSFYKKQLPYFI